MQRFMQLPKPIEIDVIILSFAHTDELQLTTINCINSLLASEDPNFIHFKILVIESYKELQTYQYLSSTTIYPSSPFGFHRYMNIGLNMTTSPYVCLCNNDLLFHKNWATEILNAMDQIPDLASASPICSIYHTQQGITFNSGNRIGYKVGGEIAGWCLFIKRSFFQQIGQLDENFIFNAADLDYASTLEVMYIKHALVTSAVVDHIRSKTLDAQNEERIDELNLGKEYYDAKWGHRILVWNQ